MAQAQKYELGVDSGRDGGADGGTEVETPNTSILKTDGSYKFDNATWVDWTVPLLE